MLLYASLTFKHVEPGFQKERFFPPLVTDENLEVAANEEGAPSQAWEGHQEYMVMFCSRQMENESWTLCGPFCQNFFCTAAPDGQLMCEFPAAATIGVCFWRPCLASFCPSCSSTVKGPAPHAERTGPDSKPQRTEVYTDLSHLLPMSGRNLHLSTCLQP